MHNFLKFEIHGKPIAKARPRFISKGKFKKAYDPQVTEAGKFMLQIGEQLPENFVPYPRETPLFLECHFWMPIPKSTSKKRQKMMLSGEIYHTKKPDGDNMLKFVKDCCSGIVWDDDSQIVKAIFIKAYSDRPRTEFNVHVEQYRSLPF